MRRKISILLMLCMLSTFMTPAYANEIEEIIETSRETVIEETEKTFLDNEETSDDEKGNEEGTQRQYEKEDIESEIEKVTTTEEKQENISESKNKESTFEEKQKVEELSSEAEQQIEKEPLPKEETTLSEDETYMLNIVLFITKENTQLESIKSKLDKLGISKIEPVFTDNEGNAKPIGKKNEVWYRAYTKFDANEITDKLTNIDGITYAEPEYVYSSDSVGEPTEIEQNTGWIYDSLLKLNSDFWWYTVLNHDFAPGKGTVVAVIDTGVDYTHEDLASNMWVNTAELYGNPGVDDDGNGYIDDICGADTTASGKKAGNPMDDNGHGTHVAGIIGMSANGIGGVGLAYGTKIMAIKAGQSTGTLASSHIAKAINYAHMMGADVINMSFGGTSKSYLVETALEDAFSDCVLVASAGNDGLPTTDAKPYLNKEDIYPAAYPYVLGVMATDKWGNLAGFSNWNYIPNKNAEYEMTAPGVDIYSTLPGNRYAKWSGTSMAAPCVSAAAAIIRSNYADKDMYSARFIMGQLASATKSKTIFVAPKKEDYEYPALNIYDSINYLPKPNISVKETFLMDNAVDGTTNDGDRIIDAGETIDLGLTVRNQWGLTGDITVKADAFSEGGVENPYVEFITDRITLEPAGTFQEVDNGYVWNDSYLESVGNPIQFKISPETPNDTEICINITVTTTNGADEKDKSSYEITAKKTFRVQAGRGISGTITEDTTLSNDYLWIIENSLYVPAGITLTIEPGTKVQFYSSDYEDSYGGKTVANILNDGTLKIIGTEEEPIEMYPGAGFENYCVEIAGDGIEILKYCNIINPRFGYIGLGISWDNRQPVNYIDHCILTQNYERIIYRYVKGSEVTSGYNDTNNNSIFCVATISHSVLRNIKIPRKDPVYISTQKINDCLFENCNIGINCIARNNLYKISNYNNVYIAGKNSMTSCGIHIPKSYPAGNINRIDTYEGSKSKYTLIDHGGEPSFRFDYYNALAKSLDGTLACIDDEDEKNLFNRYNDCMLGAKFNPTCNKHEWIDGSKYEIDTSNLQFSPFMEYPFVFQDGSKFSNNHGLSKVLIEIPIEKSDEEIIEGIANFDYNEFVKEYNNSFTNNAVLNPILNKDPSTWSGFIANSYDSQSVPDYLYNNYWGTENKTLINKMITDADDFPGTYQDIIEEPILTLESESLSEIYPFVTKVYLTDSDENIISNVTPGEDYNVHVLFNRDMDTATQPSVTYGPASPYSDYTVNGDFVSPREWVGTTRISPVLTSGTMYWRTKGGCAADDHWLVCGEDVLRFSFNISTTGTLAMLLNAEGGANKVDLSWAQNDFDTLAGYNIYRSTSETSGFNKINLSVVTDLKYTDTDVLPGVTYYYYFKVVNTDGNEEESVSNTASATPIDNIFPALKHSPVKSAKAGNQITISATATDNIEVSSVKLYYRKSGETSFQTKNMTESATKNLYVAVIPSNIVTADRVEYYVTASDADGNISYSGTAQIPNAIIIDSDAYISGITPSSVSITGGRTVSILGGNFSEDMTLKVGGNEILEKSFIDVGQINFIAPALSSGSYAVTLTTTDGKVITSPTALSYTDSESLAQIPTSMTMTSGIPYTIPFYATASGDIISVHAELDLPASDFTGVTVKKADENANFTLDYTYANGILKIGCIGTSNINSTDSALINIIAVPRVTEDKQYIIKLHDVSYNGVSVGNIISGNVHIKPSYVFTALVKYFTGTDNYVNDVEISASGVKEITNTEGKASLTVSEKNVIISALRTTPGNAVTAYDASLVLQSAIGKITLTENQKKAADVDGNGEINEYDAALILQKAVRKIDAFPTSTAWIFVPTSIEKSLSESVINSVTFTAISVGDVDGSYRGEEK